MKLEHFLAVVLAGLILLLVARSMYFPSQKRDILPVLIDIEQPFYAVYFSSPQGDLLEPEFHQGIASIEQVLTDLLAGPRLSYFVNVIPTGTEVLGYSRAGSTLYVNFSHHLISNHPGGSRGEILTVYAIVNSLTDLPGVDQVQILVENQTVPTLAGHLDLSRALHKDYAILGTSVL